MTEGESWIPAHVLPPCVLQRRVARRPRGSFSETSPLEPTMAPTARGKERFDPKLKTWRKWDKEVN